jgi:uncharacterized protein (DUF58 family)
MRDPVPGVYASLADLARLEWKARGFTFLPRQPVHSLLAGRRASRMRGRGLNFEEIRAYLPGDDVRTIDWHVTARTQKPQVRVYTEERDRPALLVVDQRRSMFFGTRRAMKSVTAAELAALAAWRAFRQGDRVGAFVFDDRDFVEVRPLRSRTTVLQIFQRILERNHALAAGPGETGHAMLNAALRAVRQRALHDCVVIVISDFDGADDETRRHLLIMSEHNDVVAVPVLDPTQSKLPERGRFVVSDGELQIEIDLGRGATRAAIGESGGARLKRLLDWQREIRVNVMPISTAEDPADQIRRLLGRRAGHAPRR